MHIYLLYLTFNSGDIEDFPGLSSLVPFKTLEKDGGVYIEGTSSELGLKRRERGGDKLDEVHTDRTVIVIGGGAAGHAAIETFR